MRNGLARHFKRPPDPIFTKLWRLFGLRAAIGGGAGLRLATGSSFVGSSRTRGCGFVSRSFGSGRAIGGLARARTGGGCQRQPAHNSEKAGQFCILHRICPFDSWCAPLLFRTHRAPFAGPELWQTNRAHHARSDKHKLLPRIIRACRPDGYRQGIILFAEPHTAARNLAAKPMQVATFS